ncbi:MAG: hypothetical protein R2751_12775 [Bacteroidales bacterium]
MKGPGNPDGPDGIEPVGVLHDVEFQAGDAVLGNPPLEGNMADDLLDVVRLSAGRSKVSRNSRATWPGFHIPPR